MKKKLEPTPIDVNYLDSELEELFRSMKYMTATPILYKYKSRFMQDKYNRSNKPTVIERRNYLLSVAKKIEILCTYGNHKLVKSDTKEVLDKVA